LCNEVDGNNINYNREYTDIQIYATAAGGQNVYLLLWYPNSSSEGYGLRYTAVSSCTSDTVLTLSEVWPNDVSDCHTGGCNYSYDDPSYG